MKKIPEFLGVVMKNMKESDVTEEEVWDMIGWKHMIHCGRQKEEVEVMSEASERSVGFIAHSV